MKNQPCSEPMSEGKKTCSSKILALALLSTITSLSFPTESLSDNLIVGGRFGMNINNATEDRSYRFSGLNSETSYSAGVVLLVGKAIRLNTLISYDRIAITATPTYRPVSFIYDWTEDLVRMKFDYVSISPSIQLVSPQHLFASMGFSIGFKALATGEYADDPDSQKNLSAVELARFGLLFGCGADIFVSGIMLMPALNYNLGLSEVIEDRDVESALRLSNIQFSITVFPFANSVTD